jgi:hypothetical protein
MVLQKLVSFTKKVADLPDKPTLNASELKNQFDAAPEELRGSFNNLIDALTNAGVAGPAYSYPVDLDNVADSGFYYANDKTLNTPVPGRWYKVLVLGGTDVTQVAFGVTDTSIVYRIKNSGVWNARTKFAADASASWANLSLVNGWANYNNGYRTAQYKKDVNGDVCLRGMVSSGTATYGYVLFNLPAGFRPQADEIVDTVCYNGSSRLLGSLRIQVNGDVTVDYLPGNAWVSINNIRFSTN